MGLSEREKMLSGERYSCHDPELARMAVEARRRVAAFCASDPGDAEERFRLLGQIFGRVERGVHIDHRRGHVHQRQLHDRRRRGDQHRQAGAHRTGGPADRGDASAAGGRATYGSRGRRCRGGGDVQRSAGFAGRRNARESHPRSPMSSARGCRSMGMTGLLEDVHMAGIDVDADVATARSGDEASFGRLVERHRRELHVHCYRMIGSFTDAEDLVQETFLRAWRHRNTFEGAGFRAWLYRIATNACLDAIRRNKRQLRTLNSFAEVPWLQPYPDRLLDEVAPHDAEPDAVAVARETIELGFLATMQLLPGQQRAVFILRDVLGWSAAETAKLLETSVAAANSALQRARATMRASGRGRLPEQSEPANDLTAAE